MRPFSIAQLPAVSAGAASQIVRPSLVRCLGTILLGVVVAVPAVVAQEDEPWQRETRQRRGAEDRRFDFDEGWMEPESDRGGGRERLRERLGREPDASLRVRPMPRRPTAQRLTLGVYASPAEVGYRIDGVLRGTPAARVGLEPGDVIVTIDGYQIGQVGGGFYPLGRELQLRGGEDLEVVLVVQNVRNRRLINLDVEFRSRLPRRPFFRDRGFSDDRSDPRGAEAPQEGVNGADVQGEREGELQ